MREPADVIEEVERNAELPPGTDDRFSGYGVMGMPFRSGHILALRRFPASSVGPGYRSVWHRDPAGRWTFFQDQPTDLACTRYFGSAVADVHEAPIEITWTGPRSLQIRVGEGVVEWTVTVAPTAVTRLFSAFGGILPERAWRSRRLLGVMGRIAGSALRAGRVRLTGLAPNGQHFIANPRTLWVATASHAIVDGVDLGPMGPAPPQASLGDFAIPQRGVLAVGSARFSSGSSG